MSILKLFTKPCAFCGNTEHNYDRCTRMGAIPSGLKAMALGGPKTSPSREIIDSSPSPEFKSPTEEIDHDFAVRLHDPETPRERYVDEQSQKSQPAKFNALALAMVAVTSFIMGVAVTGSHLVPFVVRLVKAVF